MSHGHKKRGANAGAMMADEAWQGVLSRLDSQTLRRAKLGIKQGDIGPIAVQDERIVATVHRRGAERKSGKVSLPLVDSFAPYRRSVATWFAQRPDWLAALMAGEWNEEFLTFVQATGLRLFPRADGVAEWLSQATCECDDWEQPCRHVTAVIYQMATATSPLAALSFVGLPLQALLDDVHRITAEWVAEHAALSDAAGDVGQGVQTRCDGVEEQAVFALKNLGTAAKQGAAGLSTKVENAAKPGLSQINPTFDDAALVRLKARFLRLT